MGNSLLNRCVFNADAAGTGDFVVDDAVSGYLTPSDAGAVNAANYSYSAVQATEAAQPLWSATSFNGSPGITFDGSDDELTLASVPFATSANTDTSTIPSTGTTRTRIGSNNSNTAGNFWNGKIRDIVVTSALTTEQRTALKTFLLSRRNL